MKTPISVGIVNNNGQILMIKRATREGDLLWQFPAGKLESGETAEQAVSREVKEETGVEVKVIKSLGERIHPYTERQMSYFLCEPLDCEAVIDLSVDEVAECRYAAPREVFDLVTTEVFAPVRDFIQGLDLEFKRSLDMSP